MLFLHAGPSAGGHCDFFAVARQCQVPTYRSVRLSDSKERVAEVFLPSWHYDKVTSARRSMDGRGDGE